MESTLQTTSWRGIQQLQTPKHSHKTIRLGVRQRVVLILLGGLILSLTVSGWSLLREQSKHVNEAVNRHGTQLSQILASSLANNVVGYDYHGIQLFLDEISLSADVSYVKVLSAKGNVMAETQVEETQLPKLRMFHEDIRIGDSVVGKLTVGFNTASIVAQIEKQKDALIAREVSTILFILILEFVALSWLIVRPLAKISGVLALNTGKDGVLPEAIELNSSDEFGDIARKFNHMRTQLNTAHKALTGKVESADKKLKEANIRLIKKSRELEQSNLELEKMTITDPLTGLYNRRKFQFIMNSEVAKMLSEHMRFSLLVTDIDDFKKINDQYGHDAGDLVLQEIAQRLTRGVRKSDTLCRIGGEEFAILCKEAGAEDAIRIADKLRKIVEEKPILIDDKEISVTTSVGISSPGDQTDIDCPDCLYRQADLALYQSKSLGRNRVTHFRDTDLEELQSSNG